MTPRLLTRTHFQIDEPAYLRIVVLRCTSPTRSEYRERVADRLVAQIRVLRPGSANTIAARYAIDLGRATGLINNNHTWTDRGHLLNLVIPDSEGIETMDLSPPEQVFFFRLLLETDGAAIVYFLKELRSRSQLPDDARDWNDIANELFLWTFKAYYIYATDLAARTQLRHLIQRREAKPFSGHSGKHQCFFHLQSLFRLGLVGKAGGDDSRVYVDANQAASTLADLSGVEALEEALKNQNWKSFARNIYVPTVARSGDQPDEANERFYGDIFSAYRRLSDTGVLVCPLRTLIEAVQIEEIIRGEVAQPYEARLEALKRLQRKHPRQVHFHVDRLGRPAYLKLGSDLVRA